MARTSYNKVSRVRFSYRLLEYINSFCNSEKYVTENTTDMILAAKHGDAEVKDYIARSNCGLIISAIDRALASGYTWHEENHDELFACAGLDFSKCINEYDPSKGKFSTYVYETVKFNTFKRLKNSSTHEAISFEELTEYIDYASEDNDPVSECEIRAIEGQISDILGRALNIEEEIIVKLRCRFYGKEYKTAELGELFGCTDSYAGKRLKKSYSKIHEYLISNDIELGVG